MSFPYIFNTDGINGYPLIEVNLRSKVDGLWPTLMVWLKWTTIFRSFQPISRRLAISDALKDSWLDQIFNTRFVSWFKHWEYTEIRGCAAVLNTQVGDPVVLISFFFLFKCVFESFWLYSSPDLDRWAPPDSCIVLIIVFSDRGSPAGKLNENS